MRFRNTALLSVAMVCVLVAGCGDDSESSAGGSKKEAADTVSPVTGKPVSDIGAGKKITVIVPAEDRDVYIAEKAGAEQAAKDYPKADVDVVSGKSIETSDDVIALTQTATVKGADVIVVNTGAPVTELFPALKVAMAKGIKVISYDANVNVPGLTAYVGVDNEEHGRAAGDWLKEQLPDGGPIGFLMCVPGHPVTEAKKKGFMSSVKGSNLKIVSNLNADCDPAKGRSVMDDMITSHPEIKAVMSVSDAQTLGAVQALKAQNKDPIFASIDASAAALKLIKAGNVLDASVPQYSFRMAYDATAQAVKVAAGQSVPATSNATGPYEVVDKDNVQKFLDTPNLQ